MSFNENKCCTNSLTWGQPNCCTKGPKHPNPKDVILACGREVNTIDRTFTRGDLPIPEPVVLARVFVDTNCLCKPIVKIDFSTLIRYADNGGLTILLTFKLFKQCNNGPKIALETYQFERGAVIRTATNDLPIEFITIDSFGFTFCDDETCSGDCCVYTVELTNVEIPSTSGQSTVDNVRINKSAINAIAQGLCD